MARKITELNAIVEFNGTEIILARQGAEDMQGGIGLLKDFFLEKATTILPDMTGAENGVSTMDIGSETKKIRNIYADEVFVGASSLYVNGKKVIEDISNTITFSTTENQSMHVRTSGAGGNLHFFSDDQINANAKGGIEWIVPSDTPSKNMNFTNQSVGGTININSGADPVNIASTNGVNVNANLNVDQNLVVSGNFTVNGEQTIVNAQTVAIEDNIIEINSNQTGTPASSLRGGIVVNRGDSTNYEFVFVEQGEVFKVGQVGQLQAVATRQDSPTNNAIPVWNDTAKRLDSSALTVSGSTITGSVTGSAGSADTLTTARNIALTGDVSGNANFDGSAGISITTTVANNSHTHLSANITDATHTNTANMIVRRDGSGNFAGGAITGDSFNFTTAGRAAKVTSGTSFPGGAGLGDEVYRTDLDEFYKYNGTVWMQI